MNGRTVTLTTPLGLRQLQLKRKHARRQALWRVAEVAIIIVIGIAWTVAIALTGALIGALVFALYDGALWLARH
jgi:hypothetical protein